MFRSKIENRSKFLADVDAYIMEHEQVSLEDLIQSMQELGYYCTPRMMRPILKESGLTVKSVNGRWFWSVWDDEEVDKEELVPTNGDDEVDEDEQEVDDDEVDDDDEADERPDPESIKRVETENKRLQSENNQLMVAMLKTTQLKKSIKAMQEKLLVELADLIHATYGERESESAKQESD